MDTNAMRKRHEDGPPLPALEARPQSLLDAIEALLRTAERPLHAREIASILVFKKPSMITGITPWKTVTARLSTEILKNREKSRFIRAGHAIFGLREWEDQQEYAVKRRNINPIDEIIKAVPLDVFLSRLGSLQDTGLFSVSFRDLVESSINMDRRSAESSTAFVQLIPTFVVRRGGQILTYLRTRRLPEARLHHTRCVFFGGHMQADDAPTLFANDRQILDDFIFRELREELKITGPHTSVYRGALYLTENDFERQHTGLIFDVLLGSKTAVQSLEPGMHADVRFFSSEDAGAQPQIDSWSRHILNSVKIWGQ